MKFSNRCLKPASLVLILAFLPGDGQAPPPTRHPSSRPSALMTLYQQEIRSLWQDLGGTTVSFEKWQKSFQNQVLQESLSTDGARMAGMRDEEGRVMVEAVRKSLLEKPLKTVQELHLGEARQIVNALFKQVSGEKASLGIPRFLLDPREVRLVDSGSFFGGDFSYVAMALPRADYFAEGVNDFHEGFVDLLVRKNPQEGEWEVLGYGIHFLHHDRKEAYSDRRVFKGEEAAGEAWRFFDETRLKVLYQWYGVRDFKEFGDLSKNKKAWFFNRDGWRRTIPPVLEPVILEFSKKRNLWEKDVRAGLLALANYFEEASELALGEGLTIHPLFYKTRQDLFDRIAANPRSLELLWNQEVLSRLRRLEEGAPYLFKLFLLMIVTDPESVGEGLFKETSPRTSYGERKGALEKELLEIDREFPEDAPNRSEDLRSAKLEKIKRFLRVQFLRDCFDFEEGAPMIDKALPSGGEEIFKRVQSMMLAKSSTSKLFLYFLYQADEEYLQTLFGKPASRGSVVTGGSNARHDFPFFDYDAIFVYEKDGQTSGGIKGVLSNKEYFDQLSRLVARDLEQLGYELEAHFQNLVFESFLNTWDVRFGDKVWAISMEQVKQSLAHDRENAYRKVRSVMILDHAAGDPALAREFIRLIQFDMNDETVLKEAMADLYGSFIGHSPSKDPINIKKDRGGLRMFHEFLKVAAVYKRLMQKGFGTESASFNTDTLSLVRQTFSKEAANRLSRSFSSLILLRFRLDLFYGRNEKNLPQDHDVLSRLASFASGGKAISTEFMEKIKLDLQETSRLMDELVEKLFQGDLSVLDLHPGPEQEWKHVAREELLNLLRIQEERARLKDALSLARREFGQEDAQNSPPRREAPSILPEVRSAKTRIFKRPERQGARFSRQSAFGKVKQETLGFLPRAALANFEEIGPQGSRLALQDDVYKLLFEGGRRSALWIQGSGLEYRLNPMERLREDSTILPEEVLHDLFQRRHIQKQTLLSFLKQDAFIDHTKKVVIVADLGLVGAHEDGSLNLDHLALLYLDTYLALSENKEYDQGNVVIQLSHPDGRRLSLAYNHLEFLKKTLIDKGDSQAAQGLGKLFVRETPLSWRGQRVTTFYLAPPSRTLLLKEEDRSLAVEPLQRDQVPNYSIPFLLALAAARTDLDSLHLGSGLVRGLEEFSRSKFESSQEVKDALQWRLSRKEREAHALRLDIDRVLQEVWNQYYHQLWAQTAA